MWLYACSAPFSAQKHMKQRVKGISNHLEKFCQLQWDQGSINYLLTFSPWISWRYYKFGILGQWPTILPSSSAYPILSCPLKEWSLQHLPVPFWSLGTQVMSENYRIRVSGEGLQLGPLFWLDENRQGRSKSIKIEIQISPYPLYFIPAPPCFLQLTLWDDDKISESSLLI